MPSLVLVLGPSELANPDADLRYVLPDLIAARSEGVITADGYDYLDDDRMVVFLRTSHLAPATAIVLETIRTARPLGNRLDSAVVASREEDDAPLRVVHPSDRLGLLLPL